MENERENRGLDLEKELTCSVSRPPIFCPARRASGARMRHLAALPRCPCSPHGQPGRMEYCLLMLIWFLNTDLHRSPLPTPHPPRLPTYLLRLLPERMVRLPTLLAPRLALSFTRNRTALHMSLLPSACP
jgi:hypothetical protein